MNSPTYIPCPGTFWLLYELPSKLSSLFSHILLVLFLATAIHIPNQCPPCPTDISPALPTLSSVMLQSLSHPLSHWPLFFLHTHLLSPNSFLSFTDTPKYINILSCQSLPYHSQWNSPTISQYLVKDWESSREQLKPLLALREEEWDEKKGWSLTMLAWVVSLVLLCTGCYIWTPHASFFWWQVLESTPWDQFSFNQWSKEKNENPSSHTRGSNNSRDQLLAPKYIQSIWRHSIRAVTEIPAIKITANDCWALTKSLPNTV